MSRITHYAATLAYDGTDFVGWQSQSSERPYRTVQGVLEGALGLLAGDSTVRVAGAGRTDAGVHALGQVASFALPREWETRTLQRALNGLLPADVRAVNVVRTSETFHARRSARSKLYRYMLDTGPLQLPNRRRIAGHVPWILDPDAVRRAAALYEGRQDFASVASTGSSVKTTTRNVTRSEVWFDARLDVGFDVTFEGWFDEGLQTVPDRPPCGPVMFYEVEADGFLRKMVRSLVGGLIAVGRRALSLADLEEALRSRSRASWPAPAEARGLTLVRVDYDPDPRC